MVSEDSTGRQLTGEGFAGLHWGWHGGFRSVSRYWQSDRRFARTVCFCTGCREQDVPLADMGGNRKTGSMADSSPVQLMRDEKQQGPACDFRKETHSGACCFLWLGIRDGTKDSVKHKASCAFCGEAFSVDASSAGALFAFPSSMAQEKEKNAWDAENILPFAGLYAIMGTEIRTRTS